MSTSMTVGACGAPRVRDWTGGLLPADPFTSVRYHYGMLLGEEDFVTDQAYHRGKQRLHSAAFHGAGVRWGFDVALVEEDGAFPGDLQVEPGLALDPLGHELHIDRPWCADLPRWFEEHGEDDGLTVREDGDRVVFDAHVVVCFRACLSRPVPALVDPCDGEGSDVECSRIQETVRLELRPGAAPDRPARAGHLMRIFLGLDGLRADYPGERHEDAARFARDRRTALVAEADPEARATLLDETCLRLSALDTVLWAQGGEGAFPAVPADPCVILADVADITLSPREDGGWSVESARVDVGVRRALLSTDALQELVCGCRGGSDSGEASTATEGDADAGGPRVDASAVELTATEVVLPFQGDPLNRSLEEPGAVSIESFQSSSGWTALGVDRLDITRSGGDATVRVVLVDPPPDGALRVVVRGTGPRPVLTRLGDLFIPLAGAVGGPPAGPHDGHDFVHMITVRS